MQPLHDAGQKIGPNGGQNAQSQPALKDPATLGCGPQVLKLIKDLARALNHLFAGRGDLCPGTSALKQSDPQIRLDLGQLCGQAGLADIQPRRRKTDLTSLCHCDDIFELAKRGSHIVSSYVKQLKYIFEIMFNATDMAAHMP
jgi:hypothetical protein